MGTFLKYLNNKSSIYLSLGLHALLVLVCALMLHGRPPAAPSKSVIWIEVAPNALAPKPAPTPDKNTPNRRIVQTEKGETADHPAPHAFLGERTQTVDRQTVSKNHIIALGHDGAKPSLQHTDSKSKPVPKPEAPVARAPKTSPLPKVTDLGKLGLAMVPNPKQMDEIIRKKKDQGDRPEWASAGANAPQDYVAGIKEGEHTALNTEEFVFFGYYQRIRERLDRAWIPILREKLTAHFQAGRRIASDMEHATSVVVVLNIHGEIVHVRVTSESGTTVLDDAAVAAFNQAGPFPNPPRGMIDRQGEIKIPWEFILRS
jgi:TonB family protein